MFGKDFQRKYALTDQGIKNTKTGTLWTVIVNLVVMCGMGILYLMIGNNRMQTPCQRMLSGVNTACGVY